MEETFLVDRGTTGLLTPGGVLCYIIPHSRIHESIARHLAGWYTDLRCFKLPGEEYDVFKQVVIFGVRRADYATPTGEALSDVLAWRNGQRFAGYDDANAEAPIEKDSQSVLGADGQTKKTAKKKIPRFESLPELTAGSGEYIIPPSPLKGKRGAAFRWQYTAVSDDDYLREADDCAARLEAGREWRSLAPRTEPPVVEPAITPKKGHIAMLISGGLLGTNFIRQPSGDALLLKGNISKYTITKHEVLSDDDDDDGLTKVETEERFKTQLAVLNAAGELTVTEDAWEIGKLLETHVEQLAEIVQARNRPLYDMKPDEGWEWAVFDPLSRGRKLPGRGDETGLTTMQKHLTVALGRLALKYGSGIANAEMGSRHGPGPPRGGSSHSANNGEA